MRISRGTFLASLNTAYLGVKAKETVEQSSCFIFYKGGELCSFNDEVSVRMPNPLAELCVAAGRDVVVSATDLIQAVGKLPDEELKIKFDGSELRLSGAEKTREAGIACLAEAVLAVGDVPRPTEWSRIGEGVAGVLKQAARVCSTNENQFLATCVHVAPDRVEACDNMRFFRVECETGFPQEVLIPARNVSILEGVEVKKVGFDSGPAWVHFKTSSGAVVSVRGSREPYHEDIDAILHMDDATPATLPGNLKEILERAGVFLSSEDGYDSNVTVSIDKDCFTVQARKDGGWYRERQAVKYSGPPLTFSVNPDFLVDIIGRTRDVLVNERRIKIAGDKVQFVAALLPPTN